MTPNHLPKRTFTPIKDGPEIILIKFSIRCVIQYNVLSTSASCYGHYKISLPKQNFTKMEGPKLMDAFQIITLNIVKTSSNNFKYIR
jgi:hypothetical protein